MITEGRITNESIKSKLYVDEFGLFRDKNFCDTCGHQYSDICGTCESLDGVPVKYTSDRAVMLPNLEEFMEQFKVVDTDHVYSNGVEFVPIFRVKHWIEYQKSKKKTNADRIRNMDNNQLSELLQRQICGICILFYYCQAHRGKRPCSEVIDEWLKQEVSDDS